MWVEQLVPRNHSSDFEQSLVLSNLFDDSLTLVGPRTFFIKDLSLYHFSLYFLTLVL